MKTIFEHAFETIETSVAKLSIDGKIAIRAYNTKDYKAYDVETNKLIDCTDFCLDMPANSIIVIPTKVEDLNVGDIVVTNTFEIQNINCVTDIKNGELTVINYTSEKKETVLPKYFVFMKNTAYILKIVNMFGNIFKGLDQNNDMMKYFMMTQMMNGEDRENKNLLPMMFMMNDGNLGGDNEMMKYFMMTNMMNGENKNNMLSMMFMMNNGNFSFDNLFGNDAKAKIKKTK